MNWPWQKPKAEPVRPPKVGGTIAPDQVLRIDFDKPHDFHFNFHSSGTVVFCACVLVGFTTPVDSEGNKVSSDREWGEWSHNLWLVLRRPDGRLIYVPRDNLQYIVESSRDGIPP